MLEVEISLPGKSITFGILQQYLVSTSRKKGSSECGASDPWSLAGYKYKTRSVYAVVDAIYNDGEGCGYGYGGDVRGMQNEMCC